MLFQLHWVTHVGCTSNIQFTSCVYKNLNFVLGIGYCVLFCTVSGDNFHYSPRANQTSGSQQSPGLIASLSTQKTASVEWPCVLGESCSGWHILDPGEVRETRGEPGSLRLLHKPPSTTRQVSKGTSWRPAKSRAAGAGCSKEGSSWHPV